MQDAASTVVGWHFSQAFLALFTASHTFDAPDHFFPHTFIFGAVKLTSPEGVGSWHW
jgi:hypothetical protein